MSGPGLIRPLVERLQNCPSAYLLYNFDIGSARLKPEHQAFLQDPVMRILRNTGNQVRIIGRASHSGPERRNLDLSRQRADAVWQFLRQQGMQGQQLTVQFFGEQHTFSLNRESDEDRSVEVQLTVNPTFTLFLNNPQLVRPTDVLRERIRQGLQPLVSAAGRRLSIISSRLFGGSIDVSLTFLRGATRDIFGPGGQHSALGVTSPWGGDINVDVHLDARVGGRVMIPRRVAEHRAIQDFGTPAELLFQNGEVEFALFVANTCLHELGHVIGDLPDRRSNPEEIMFSYDVLQNFMLPEIRSREGLRRYFSRAADFTPLDRAQMICAIHRGYYRWQTNALP